jgi:dTDP-4-amino-4,6-dideoxy-D-galactose acyltransferase
MKIKKLVWDSEFFGYKIGLIDINNYDFVHYLHFDSQFDLIYLFSDKKQVSDQLSEHVDMKITYEKYSNFVEEMPGNIEEYKGKLTNELLYLALLSGHHSRFKNAIHLANHYERLYKTWIQKSIDGVIADKVLIYKVGFKILGFITLKEINECVQIGLIAVHDNHMGKGIGSSLLRSI